MTKVLVVVDVQNDFVDGSLAVNGSLEAIKNINKLMDTEEFDRVITTQDWHPETHKSFSEWPVHCVANTHGADFHDSFNLDKVDFAVHKGVIESIESYSGMFDESEQVASHLVAMLDLIVNENSEVEITVCGIATDYCVKATAWDIFNRYDSEFFKLRLCENACAAVNDKDVHFILSEMKHAGIEVFNV